MNKTPTPSLSALASRPIDQKTKELLDKFQIARQCVQKGTTWRHYKGGTYRIVGYVFDVDAQVVKARYVRIDGPGYDIGREHDIEFSRDVAEWRDIIPASTRDGVPAEPERQRFVRVEKIERYESADEIEQRG